MNPHLDKLQPYPFERLRKLFEGIEPNPNCTPVSLGIGEPQHAAPAFVRETVSRELDALARYPTTLGVPALREAIAAWLTQRFALSGVDAQHQVLPVNGTREALFAFAQAVVDGRDSPVVLCPNPFYQIYEGAALLAGAQPVFLNCTPDNNYQPNFEAVDEQTWERCQLLYLCSPGNPTGAVLPLETLQFLIEKAERYQFVLASDECYSEIYGDEATPPPGLLQACRAMGNDEYRHCVVFHSLSKRSNLPGLRSGFAAGDARILARFAQYRTYHGCAMPLHHQMGSIAAWGDETHVRENRARYREKFDAVLAMLDGVLEVQRPQAGFYLWPVTPASDTEFARQLYARENLTVLPGSFLARSAQGVNPGTNRVRLALVAELDACVEAAQRIVRVAQAL